MPGPAVPLSLDGYLEREAGQPSRNELVAGVIIAVADPPRVHGTVHGNLAAALMHALRGSRCRVFATNLMVQISSDTAVYPDVFVTCDPADLKTDMIFRRPLLVVEVLSDSTQAYDRGLKFAAYRRLESLQEYVLVDPDTRRVEVYRRNERGNFELLDQTGADELQLASVELRLPMAEVFDGLDDEAPAAGP